MLEMILSSELGRLSERITRFLGMYLPHYIYVDTLILPAIDLKIFNKKNYLSMALPQSWEIAEQKFRFMATKIELCMEVFGG